MKRQFDSRSFLRIFRFTFVILFFLAVHPGLAREIAGVVLPETVTLENQALVLNGAGIRKKFFVKVYVGGLYLMQKKSTVEQVMADQGTKRIVMHFLYKEVSADKLINGWNEGFTANTSPDDLKMLQERISQFNGCFTSVRRGDVVRLDYIPEQGTRVWINGTLKGEIPGEDFSRALLMIWLGEKPADAGLKDAMLGSSD